MNVDEAIFRWLNGLYAPGFDQVVSFLINDYLIPVLAALALGWMWFAGRDVDESDRFQRAALAALLTMAWITVFVQVTNAIWPRPRPFDVLSDVRLLFYTPRDPSFPAHPVAILTGVGVTLFGTHRRISIGIITLAVLFGTLRVVAGVWFPSDVLGGVVYGLVGASLGWWLLGRIPRAAAALRSLADRLGLS